jgi:tetratricopeptide (TPR) repeat protein
MSHSWFNITSISLKTPSERNVQKTLASLHAAIILFTMVFCGWSKANASDSWIQVTSAHFTVVSNAGEKEARRIANQFEEIRSVFRFILPAVRVDSGRPLTVIAVKNEDSLKAFLPDYWTGKDRARPAGLFLSGFDESFGILRTDITGSAENPYHSLYHEYTHSILRLNFSALPVWLNEGLAEFYGNTVVTDNEIQIGRPSGNQLALLRRSNLIPLDQLLNADQRSPLYNEQDRASIFYAESWALVHYLILDDQASKQQYLSEYLKAWDETRDGEEAARRTFKDLKQFQAKLDSYIRQPAFNFRHGKPQAKFSSNDYTVRSITPAEALVVQADFFQHYGHANDARRLLKQAQEAEPNLATLHACLGYDNYVQYNNEEAEQEFKQAVQLNPQDFRPYFYLAEIAYRKNSYRVESTPQIIAYLEKVVQLNPNFAPAYAFLSVAYRQQPKTREKALDAGFKANQLDPSVLAYVADVGDALMALDRDAEARTIGEKLKKAARSPQEKALAQRYGERLARHGEFVRSTHSPGTLAAAEGQAAPAQDAIDTGQSSEIGPSVAERPKISSEEGVIRDVDCASSHGVTIKFAILGETLLLSVTDLTKIEYRAGGKDSTADAQPCSQWKGRKARITFKPSETHASGGEVSTIDFL